MKPDTSVLPRIPAIVVAIVLALAAVIAFPAPAHAASWTVSSAADDNSVGTIRWAAANAGENDTISVEVDLAPASTVTFVNGVTIVGVGTRTITRGANADFPIFTIDPTAVLQNYTISNFTFTGGTGTGPAIQSDVSPAARTLTIDNVDFVNHTATAGAALDLEALSVGLTVVNSAFAGNTATAGDGGAIRATLGQGGIDISGTTFTGNAATGTGGAGHVTGGAANPYTVQNVTATGNTSNSGGGAFYLDGGFGTTITGSTFGNNQAQTAGGAVYALPSRTITVSDTTFTSNVSLNNRGGGLTISSAPFGYTLSGLTFTGNEADIAGGALAFFSVTGSGTLSSSTFTSNSSNNDGGAIWVENSGALQGTGLTFDDNTADNGGAVYVSTMGDTVSFARSAFLGNNAIASVAGDGNGGAIAVNALSKRLVIDTCRFVGNTAESAGNSAFGAGIFLDGITASGWLDLVDSEFSENELTPGPAGDGVSIAFGAIPADFFSRASDSTFAEFASPADLANIHFADIAAGAEFDFSSLTVAGSVGMRALSNEGAVTIEDTVFDTDLDSLDVGTTGFLLLYSATSSPLSPSVQDGGNNLFGLADPKLGPLQNNGGSTRSMMPLAGSPLIDRGSPGGHDSWDQRGTGFPRVNMGRIDIGSIETAAVLPVTGREFNWWATALGGGLLLAGLVAFVIARSRRSSAGQ
jgi:LPXTG-motif cell wall-anchored protein